MFRSLNSFVLFVLNHNCLQLSEHSIILEDQVDERDHCTAITSFFAPLKTNPQLSEQCVVLIHSGENAIELRRRLSCTPRH